MLFRIITIIESVLQKIFNTAVSSSFKGAINLNIHRSAHIVGIKHIKIGNNFSAGEHLRLEAITRYGSSTFSPRIIIKDNVVLNDFVHIGATNYVEIGNNVLMASKIYISDHSHGTYSGLHQSSPDVPPAERAISNDSKVVIGDNVWIGEFVSVLPGVTIGCGSIIGANSVVNKDIPPYSIVVGSPARVIKQFNFVSNIWESIRIETY